MRAWTVWYACLTRFRGWGKKANSFSNNRPIHSDYGRQSAAIRSLLMSNLSCSSTNSIFWKPSSSRASNSHRLLLHILAKTKQNRLPSVGVKISISCLYLRKDYFFSLLRSPGCLRFPPPTILTQTEKGSSTPDLRSRKSSSLADRILDYLLKLF